MPQNRHGVVHAAKVLDWSSLQAPARHQQLLGVLPSVPITLKLDASPALLGQALNDKRASAHYNAA